MSAGKLPPSGERNRVWRYVKASRATVIIDADDYFRLMQDAMLKARLRILLIGWDFDTRIHLSDGRRWYQKGRSKQHPVRLGSFILWLTRHRSNLEIRILKWSYGTFKIAKRGSMMVDLARWAPNDQIDFKFDTAHPVGCSHHQKIVVLDNHVAVCGGIDMTTHRWDTREHREKEPRRRRNRGAYWMPWHDATMMVEGEAARALGELGEERWEHAGGGTLSPVKAAKPDVWPGDLRATFENVEIGIARTSAAYDGRDAVDEIAHLFEHQIANAKRFIYAESQYFASRRIADAICKRLAEDDPPEIVIVHPKNADGWLEQQAMDHTRAVLAELLRANDPKSRFHLYVPYTGDTPIYVHAKIMIIDDRVLRIGSANMNNRSLGLDSECDMFIDADRPGNESAGDNIAGLRYSLLAEHCGLDERAVPALLEQYGSMAAMIESEGQSNSRTLRRYVAPELNQVERELAESQFLDPERPDDMFEPYAKDGLFRKRTALSRARAFLRRRRRK